MKKYPHGLDEEMLPRDLEIEQEKVEEDENRLKEAIAGKNALLIKALGEEYYSVACYGYALGESAAKIREPLLKSLENHFLAFKMGVVTDVYEFITLLSLAAVLNARETAQSLAGAKRERYTNPNIEAEEIVFTVAGLMSAFVKKDATATNEILEANNPDEINTKKIYRYDRMIFFPLLQLLAAISRKDANLFASALQTRHEEFVKFYSRVPLKNMPEALIDMPGLAAAAFAGEHGIKFTDTSVYRPYDLIVES